MNPQPTPPLAGATGSVNNPCLTIDECIAWAEHGEMCCGLRTERAIKTLASEVRRLRDALGRIAEVGHCGSGVAPRIAKDTLSPNAAAPRPGSERKS